jgi:WD40 repeat protein
MAGGDGGEVIVPGKSADSRLMQMLLGVEEPKMPPKKAKQPTPDEIALIQRWIDLGAKGPVSSAPQSADELILPKIERKVVLPPAITSVCYSAEGKWLAAARHRDVIIIDAATGQVARTLTGAENPVNAVAFSRDGTSVAAAEGLASVVGKVRIWNLVSDKSASEENVRTLTGHADSIYALAFSPDGTQLVTASYDKLLFLWDLAKGTRTHTLKHHTAAVFGAVFSPDGHVLASVAADQTVKLWNVATGQRIVTLTEPTKGLNAVAFHPAGTELAAAGSDKMIRVYSWNGTAARLKRSAFAHDAPILAIAYSPDGATLFTASEDRRIKAWDSAALQERHVYGQQADWPLTLAVSPTGEQLAAGLYNGELALFDPKSPRKISTIEMARRSRPGARSTGDEISRGSPEGGLPLASILAATTGQQPGQAADQNAEKPAEAPKPNPPTPRLDAVRPRAVVRGNKIKFTLTGPNIAAADEILVSKRELKVTLLPADPKNANAAFCEIDIPADTPVGTISLRLHTPLGTAGTKSFHVGPFSELAEKEENNSRDKAPQTTFPRTLTGTINSRGDRHLWSFDARAGDELVFLLIGPGLGSSLQGKLSLWDESGRVLATAVRQPARGEVVLGRRFDRPGKYFLQVEDRDNMGGGNHFYLIHAGAFPYVTDAWPLGLHASDQGKPVEGEASAVELAGFNLAPETRLRPIPGVATRRIAPFTPTGRALNTVRYEASPFPEFAEHEPNETPAQAQPLPIPGAVSGRIAGFAAPSESATNAIASGAAGAGVSHSPSPSPSGGALSDSDHFSFTARRGDRLTIETFARRLGSPVDTVLDILDANGKPVPRATLRAVAETYTVLRDHDSRSKGIRLQNWDDLQPNDYVMIGGEVVKVQVLPLGPDEDVKFFDRSGPREAFFGTTPEAHAINSPAFKVEMHPPGVSFPPNGMPVVPLDWRNDDAPGLGSDSQVLFDVPAEGVYLVRVRDVRDLAADDFTYRLVVRPRHEDFRIALDPENPNIPRGGSLPVTVKLDRLEGFNGPVDVRVEGLPAGITATTTRIGPDKYSGILTLTAAETAGGSPAGSTWNPRTMRVLATATIDGQRIEHATNPGFGAHHLTITSPPDIRVSIEPQVAEMTPGQQLRFTVSIERRNAFVGRVPVEVLNLPHGLHVLDVGLNGVLINENETSRSFVVVCEPWAAPGPVTFYAAARVEAKNERHAGAPIRLEVKEGPH